MAVPKVKQHSREALDFKSIKIPKFKDLEQQEQRWTTKTVVRRVIVVFGRIVRECVEDGNVISKLSHEEQLKASKP